MQKLHFLILSIFFLTPWVHAQEVASIKDPRIQSAYAWVKAVQHPSGLVSTREGKEGFCFVYDQALAIYVFLLFNDIERAEKVLDFFNSKYEHQLSKGNFIGFVDMHFSTGAEGATYRAGGPNAWLLNAINEYSYKTKSNKYLPLAEEIANWLITLQAIDGGMMGGHHPNLHFISTEHNADAYAALRNLYLLTQKPIYAQKAEEFKKWILQVAYIPEDKRFGNGKDDPNYALDTSSWTVLALGKEVEQVLDIAETVAQNTQYYECTQTNVEGFDFGGPYYDSPYPDKDAVWFEGTAQMILAYRAVGKNEKAEHFLNETKKCLTESTYHPKTFGLPYASNAGTPAYGGWQMTHTPLCLSSTAWYLFAKLNYNPFNLGGSLLFDDKKFNWPPKGMAPVEYVKKQFVPMIDTFEGTQSQLLSSYPSSQIETQNCIFNRTIEFNEHASGEKALRLLFIPRQVADAKEEVLNQEIYQFDLPKKETVIVTTSSQPESIVDDEEDISVIQEIKNVSPGEDKESQALFYRKFLVPQNWEGCKNLNFFLKHDDSSNFFFVRLKDAKGNVWTSEPIALKENGWKEHSLSFDKTALLKQEITEIGFGLKAGTSSMETILFLDDVTLN